MFLFQNVDGSIIDEVVELVASHFDVDAEQVKKCTWLRFINRFFAKTKLYYLKCTRCAGAQLIDKACCVNYGTFNVSTYVIFVKK